jgi:abequosyltransferase
VNNVQLSVCIATHNRASFIGATLESIGSQATEQVEIVVLDGASSDNTGEVVRMYQNRFPALRYFRQNKNMGIDHDFAEAVNLANGEYCWLFSDDDIIKPGAIETVLEAIKKRHYGLIIANAEVRSADLSEMLETASLKFRVDRVYKAGESRRLLADLANYLTFIGGVIIQRQLWKTREKEKYFGSYFVHVGVIFQSPLAEDVLVIAKPLISIRYGNASWLAKYFEIWMFNWPELIWSFADYPDSVKLQVSAREPWRDIKNLLLHRAKGTYTINTYRQWLEPRIDSWWSRAVTMAIAYLPGPMVNMLVALRVSMSSKSDRRQVLVDLMNSPYGFWRLRKHRETRPRKSASHDLAPVQPVSVATVGQRRTY